MARDRGLLSPDELFDELDAGLQDLWEIVEGRLPQDLQDEFVAAFSRVLAAEGQIARRAGASVPPVPPVASHCRMPCPIRLN
jgi:hypothetical protein